jgi:hypothetical protein
LSCLGKSPYIPPYFRLKISNQEAFAHHGWVIRANDVDGDAWCETNRRPHYPTKARVQPARRGWRQPPRCSSVAIRTTTAATSVAAAIGLGPSSWEGGEEFLPSIDSA